MDCTVAHGEIEPGTPGAATARPRAARRRPARLLGSVVAGLAIITVLGACSDGPGTEEDLVIALSRDEGFTEAQAVCIADNLFDDFGDDEEAIARISGARSFDDLTGENGVDGFEEAFDGYLVTCLPG